MVGISRRVESDDPTRSGGIQDPPYRIDRCPPICSNGRRGTASIRKASGLVARMKGGPKPTRRRRAEGELVQIAFADNHAPA